jgi:drug/metabolite transporter (DMT)-like permease
MSSDTVSVSTKSWLIMAALSLVWGSSYILIKRGLAVFSPDQVASLRLGITALSLWPVLVIRWRLVDWRRAHWLLIVGLCGSGIPAFLFANAQTRISSAMAGILNSLTPLFTLLLGVLLFRAAASWAKIAGVLIGLSGAILLVYITSEGGLGGSALFSMLVVVATICYAASVNTVGFKLRDLDSITISAASFAMVGTPAIIYLFTTDFVDILQHNPHGAEALGYIFLLAIFGTVLGSVFFFILVKWTNPVFSSMVSYVAPIISIMWGFSDGESIALWHFLGLALILSGVYLAKK